MQKLTVAVAAGSLYVGFRLTLMRPCVKTPAKNAEEHLIFEVIAPTGTRRFFLQPSLHDMSNLLSNHPQMMGADCVAEDSAVNVLTGSRESQVDYVLSFVPQWHLRKWCAGGMCACMGCANGSGGLAALGITEDEWKAYRSRQIQFIGITSLES